MAQSQQMYCSEQIIIPEILPNILKTYAKAAIRTQPFDLLRWSAAYFRCKAMNVPPPVKIRLEKPIKSGYLTKGYLRILLEQVGKGFFINRDILQNKWESLSLPEDELLKFLSICRMLNWPQVHWLKLFAVMVGSLNKNFRSTIEMICELLTNEPAGGPNQIPMWMFRECYVFIGELDCSEEQEFKNGRKVLKNGQLEEINEMPNLPKLLTLETFRNAVLEKYHDRLGINEIIQPSDFPIHDPKFVSSSTNISEVLTDPSNQPIQISSSFGFMGDFENPTEIIRRTPDFDSVILLLQETQGFEIHEYNGPQHIGEKEIRRAERRENEIIAKRAQQAKSLKAHAEQIKSNEEIIPPPWSWMQHFALQNTIEKSYNFIETQSIVSDETLASESSAESLDSGGRDKFEKEDSTVVAIEKALLSPTESQDALKLLDCDDETKNAININGLLDKILNSLNDAIKEKEIDLTDTQSLVKFMDKNEKPHLPYEQIKQCIEKAEKENIIFKNLQELKDYLEETLHVNNNHHQLIVTEKQLTNLTSNDDIIIDSESKNSLMTNYEENLSTKNPLESSSDENSVIEIVPAKNIVESKLEDKFNDCQIDVDAKIKDKQIPENMIIGLAQTESEETIPPKSPTTILSSTTTEPHDTSSGKDGSNLTSRLNDFLILPSEEQKIPPPVITPPSPFDCRISIIPGIGKTISKKTMQSFLTYLKKRSRSDKGMVYPRHFKETKCPHMIDSSDER